MSKQPTIEQITSMAGTFGVPAHARVRAVDDYRRAVGRLRAGAAAPDLRDFMLKWSERERARALEWIPTAPIGARSLLLKQLQEMAPPPPTTQPMRRDAALIADEVVARWTRSLEPAVVPFAPLRRLHQAIVETISVERQPR